jgi:hypothetical protein
LQDIDGSIVTFTLSAVDGSPDMAICSGHLPSAVEYTWRVACVGRREARIVVYPSDADFIRVGGRYCIGVSAPGPATFHLKSHALSLQQSASELRDTLPRLAESMVNFDLMHQAQFAGQDSEVPISRVDAGGESPKRRVRAGESSDSKSGGGGGGGGGQPSVGSPIKQVGVRAGVSGQVGVNDDDNDDRDDHDDDDDDDDDDANGEHSDNIRPLSSHLDMLSSSVLLTDDGNSEDEDEDNYGTDDRAHYMYPSPRSHDNSARGLDDESSFVPNRPGNGNTGESRARLLHRLSRVPGPVRYSVPSIPRSLATVQTGLLPGDVRVARSLLPLSSSNRKSMSDLPQLAATSAGVSAPVGGLGGRLSGSASHGALPRPSSGLQAATGGPGLGAAVSGGRTLKRRGQRKGSGARQRRLRSIAANAELTRSLIAVSGPLGAASKLPNQ